MHGLGKHLRELSEDDVTITLQVSITHRLQYRLHRDLCSVRKVLMTISRLQQKPT